MRLFGSLYRQAFNDMYLNLMCYMTKLDGDTRGGAAISIKSSCNKPIKLSRTGVLAM